MTSKMKRIATLSLMLIMIISMFNATVWANTVATANPTASKVLVNGANVAFDAYNINGFNYFKLRDLAYTLNGTEKQFAVSWDSAKDAISLTTGTPYAAVGGEMTGKGAGSQTAVTTTSRIYLDGEEVQFTAYNIGGNNYFKLRDVGEAINFGVDWDDVRNTIAIDTSKSYIPEHTPVALTADAARIIVQTWLDQHPEVTDFDLNNYSQDMIDYNGEEYFRFYYDQMYWLDFLVHTQTGDLLSRQTEDGLDPKPPFFEPLDDWYNRVYSD